MIGSRRPSAIRLIGFQSAIVLAGCEQQVAREERGRQEQDHEHEREDALDDARPCCARSASAAPSAPKAPAHSEDQQRPRARKPAHPALDVRAEDQADRRGTRRPTSAPRTAVAESLPSTIAAREIGDDEQAVDEADLDVERERDARARRPRASSTASSSPASWKSRKPCTFGNAGRSIARPAPPVLTARKSVGKTMIGARNCGRRKACLIDRRLSAAIDTRVCCEPRRSRGAAPRPGCSSGCSACSLPPRGGGRSSPRRRRRASAGRDSATRREGRPRRARARSARCPRRRARGRTISTPSRAGIGSPKRAMISSRALRAALGDP